MDILKFLRVGEYWLEVTTVMTHLLGNATDWGKFHHNRKTGMECFKSSIWSENF